MTSLAKKFLALAAATGVVLALSACTNSGGDGENFTSGSSDNYITEQFHEIPEAERGEPIEFSGVSEYGEQIDSKDLLGQVVVVNFWYAGCGPCRIEAPVLEEVSQKYKEADVTFVGVNTLDLADTAISFADTYGVTYHSILDVENGDVELAFAAAGPMTATPTTIILDKQGRPAARIISAVTDASILSTMVRDIADES